MVPWVLERTGAALIRGGAISIEHGSTLNYYKQFLCPRRNVLRFKPLSHTSFLRLCIVHKLLQSFNGFVRTTKSWIPGHLDLQLGIFATCKRDSQKGPGHETVEPCLGAQRYHLLTHQITLLGAHHNSL